MLEYLVAGALELATRLVELETVLEFSILKWFDHWYFPVLVSRTLSP